MKNKLQHDAQISISSCQASDPRWQVLMQQLELELKQLYPEMPDLTELEHAQLLLAHRHGDENSPALGCVALQALTLNVRARHAAASNPSASCTTESSTTEFYATFNTTDKLVEIKRLFVHPSMRGLGLAKRLLQQLEALAVQQQVAAIRLETGYLQHAAMALYLAMGYQAIPAYGIYIGQSYSRCFEKRLSPA